MGRVGVWWWWGKVGCDGGGVEWGCDGGGGVE